MSLNAYDLSADLFVRGLSNLKAQLAKAEEHAAATEGGEAALLDARLAAGGPGVASHPRDLHAYTLAAQVHWAAEGARLAIAHLLGQPRVPAVHDAKGFAELHQRLDATIAFLREVSAGELEAGLERTILMELPRGSVRSSGDQFLIGYAIPHFF